MDPAVETHFELSCRKVAGYGQAMKLLATTQFRDRVTGRYQADRRRFRNRRRRKGGGGRKSAVVIGQLCLIGEAESERFLGQWNWNCGSRESDGLGDEFAGAKPELSGQFCTVERDNEDGVAEGIKESNHTAADRSGRLIQDGQLRHSEGHV